MNKINAVVLSGWGVVGQKIDFSKKGLHLQFFKLRQNIGILGIISLLEQGQTNVNKTRGLRRWPSYNQFNPGSSQGGSRQMQTD